MIPDWIPGTCWSTCKTDIELIRGRRSKKKGPDEPTGAPMRQCADSPALREIGHGNNGLMPKNPLAVDGERLHGQTHSRVPPEVPRLQLSATLTAPPHHTPMLTNAATRSSSVKC